MKKYVLVLVVILLVPAAAFAEFGFGPAAFYNSSVLAGETIDEDELNAENFTFGADARLNLSLLHGEALALVTLDPFVSDIFLNAGIVLDIAILRLSAGFGPKFTYYSTDDGFVRGGYHLKANADIVLGDISLGISYIFDTTLEDGFNIRERRGMLGFAVLFW